MKLFIICGKSGSGKNSVANLIKEYYDLKNEKTMITEFSKYLKLYAHEMLNWNYEASTKPRKFLQDMGEKIRTDISQDFFINRMKEDISIYESYFDNIVISDARLVNELESMKEYYLKCYTIHVASNNESLLTKDEQLHKTEIELDDYKLCDYYLENVTEEQLKNDLIEILEEVK